MTLYNAVSRDGSSAPVTVNSLDKEVKKLKAVLKQVQSDNDAQLQLEKETQQTFEFLNQQVGALKHAYNTLSSVFSEEMDAYKRDTSTAMEALEQNIQQQGRNITSARNDVSLYRAQQASMHSELADRVEQLHGGLEALRVTQQSNHSTMENRMARIEQQLSLILMHYPCPPLNVSSGHLHHHGSSSALPGASTILDPAASDEQVQRLAKEMAHFRHAFQTLQQDHMQAASALAQDVASLAQDQAQIRKVLQSSLEDIRKDHLQSKRHVDSIGQQLMQLNSDKSQITQRLDHMSTAFASHQDAVEQRFMAAEKMQNRLHLSLEDVTRDLELDRERVKQHMRTMETHLRAFEEEHDHRLAELDRIGKKRMDQIRAALESLSKSTGADNPLASSFQ
jgi:hypothetical protein